jgi:hypothetical protein
LVEGLAFAHQTAVQLLLHEVFVIEVFIFELLLKGILISLIVLVFKVKLFVFVLNVDLEVLAIEHVDKTFEFIRVPFKMDRAYTLLADLLSYEFAFLSEDFVLLLELFELIFAYQPLFLLDWVLFDHFPFERHVEGPPVVPPLVDQFLHALSFLVLEVILVDQNSGVLVFLLSNIFHGLLDMFELGQHGVKFGDFNHVKLALGLTNRCSRSETSTLKHEFGVTKVAAIWVNSQRHVKAASILDKEAHVNVFADIAVEDHFAREQEEDLFCLVSLWVQYVIFVKVERLQFRNQDHQKLLGLVFEKPDLVYDLTMGVLYNVSP